MTILEVPVTLSTITTKLNALQSTANTVNGKVDVAVSTRASQSSVDAIKTKVDGLDLPKLDTPVSSRATQTSVDAVATKVNTLDTSKLDATVSSRANQGSVDGLQSSVSAVGGKVDLANTALGTKASQDQRGCRHCLAVERSGQVER